MGGRVARNEGYEDSRVAGSRGVPSRGCVYDGDVLGGLKQDAQQAGRRGGSGRDRGRGHSRGRGSSRSDNRGCRGCKGQSRAANGKGIPLPGAGKHAAVAPWPRWAQGAPKGPQLLRPAPASTSMPYP